VRVHTKRYPALLVLSEKITHSQGEIILKGKDSVCEAYPVFLKVNCSLRGIPLKLHVCTIVHHGQLAACPLIG